MTFSQVAFPWRSECLFLRVASRRCIAIWRAGRPNGPWGHEKKGVSPVWVLFSGRPFPAAADNRSVFGGKRDMGRSLYPNTPNFTKLDSAMSSARYNWMNFFRL